MTDVSNNSQPHPLTLEEIDMMNERKHFHRIVNAFQSYKSYFLKKIQKTLRYIGTLPLHHQDLLHSYKAQLSRFRPCIEQNHAVFRLIINDVATMFENANHSADMPVNPCIVSSSDMDKLQSVLKQIVREWAEEGRMERETCFRPIMEVIVDQFPLDKVNPRDIKILVPGAGLGRLAYEIARLGYSCQGNEYSLFMLFTSNFILNKCQGVKSCVYFPWVHATCNNVRAADLVQPVYFPDVDTNDVPPDGDFSMVAGNFTEVCTTEGEWDCVATCFFLDTCENVVLYLETIYRILKPGGVWVNLGPLLYHFADMPGEDSIEPSYEHIREICIRMGFIFLKEKLNVQSVYTHTPNSMLEYNYKSVFFVCQKPSANHSAMHEQ